ncbi:response regulator transcription factor [Virgibacillus oceani]
MIKLLLIAHDGIFNKGLRLMIDKENDMKVIGTATNENQIMKMVKEQRPDVVLLNTEISSVSDVIKMTDFIKKTLDQAKIIYLLPSSNKKVIIEGIEAGVEGFLLSQLNYKNLVHSIRDVSNEDYVISGEIAKIVINHVKMPNLDKKEIMNQKLKNKGVYPTKRELDIIYLLFKEKTNKEMAEMLQLSESTVRDYVSNTYSKIGKNNRNEVIDFLHELMGYDERATKHDRKNAK